MILKAHLGLLLWALVPSLLIELGIARPDHALKHDHFLHMVLAQGVNIACALRVAALQHGNAIMQAADFGPRVADVHLRRLRQVTRSFQRRRIPVSCVTEASIISLSAASLRGPSMSSLQHAFVRALAQDMPPVISTMSVPFDIRSTRTTALTSLAHASP